MRMLEFHLKRRDAVDRISETHEEKYMSEDMSNVHAENQTTAVSIFGEAGASGDFPVLKAFQQYIDAEQAKAFFSREQK